MTLRELINDCKYKKVFNSIYKNYYVNQPYSDSEIIEIDLSYEKIFNELKDLKQVKNVENEIYLVQAGFDGEEWIDVCLYNEKDDDIFAIDFLSWREIIDCAITSSIKLSKEETLAHILWEITFWGFSEDEIKKQGEATLKASQEEPMPFNLNELL